jgi:protein-tyrosine phosphatase
MIDVANPMLANAVGEARLANLEPSIRHYFHLQPPAGEGLIVAQRDLPLEGSINFRDLGGYRTDDGRRVKWGRLFRSGHMVNLTDADRAYLGSVDIRRVCDLRLADEQENERTELPNDPVIEILAIPPGVGDRYFFHRLFARTDDPADIVEAMHEMNRSLVLGSAQPYARLFGMLLGAADGTMLINCSAGKERTGIATALVLTALGVPRATILYDFMLSKRYFPAEAEVDRVREKYAVEGPADLARELVMPLLETRESYLESVFDVLDERFVSGEAFLRQAYGLDDADFARLRDTYTQ